MHTNIQSSSGIRTHDPSVREGEDSSRLRPRGLCDRNFLQYLYYAANGSLEILFSLAIINFGAVQFLTLGAL
jgi:hypothetical protein